MSMKVDAPNGVGPIENVKKAAPVEKQGKPESAKPLVDISQKAVDREEFMRALEIVRAAESPEARASRVAELKAKINDPAYINESIIKLTADRVTDLLLG
jgi:negative regulator of flagellin synthesis FlgM